MHTILFLIFYALLQESLCNPLGDYISQTTQPLLHDLVSLPVADRPSVKKIIAIKHENPELSDDAIIEKFKPEDNELHGHYWNRTMENIFPDQSEHREPEYLKHPAGISTRSLNWYTSLLQHVKPHLTELRMQLSDIFGYDVKELPTCGLIFEAVDVSYTVLDEAVIIRVNIMKRLLDDHRLEAFQLEIISSSVDDAAVAIFPHKKGMKMPYEQAERACKSEYEYQLRKSSTALINILRYCLELKTEINPPSCRTAVEHIFGMRQMEFILAVNELKETCGRMYGSTTCAYVLKRIYQPGIEEHIGSLNNNDQLPFKNLLRLALCLQNKIGTKITRDHLEFLYAILEIEGDERWHRMTQQYEEVIQAIEVTFLPQIARSVRTMEKDSAPTCPNTSLWRVLDQATHTEKARLKKNRETKCHLSYKQYARERRRHQ